MLRETVAQIIHVEAVVLRLKTQSRLWNVIIAASGFTFNAKNWTTHGT